MNDSDWISIHGISKKQLREIKSAQEFKDELAWSLRFDKCPDCGGSIKRLCRVPTLTREESYLAWDWRLKKKEKLLQKDKLTDVERNIIKEWGEFYGRE